MFFSPKQLKSSGIVAISMLALTGCVDNDYDLSNIETTTEIKVDNLTIPLKVDEITLDQIVKIEEDDIIKVIDGKYAIHYSGEYQSDPVQVPRIYASAPNIAPIKMQLQLPSAMPASDVELTLPLIEAMTDFGYTSDPISEFVMDIEDLTTDVEMRFAFKLNSESLSALRSAKLKDVVLHLPDGLEIKNNLGEYNVSTGDLYISEIDLLGNFNLSVQVDKIDLAYSSADFNYAQHIFTLSDRIGIKSGSLVVEVNPQGSIPSELSLEILTDMDQMDVTHISGVVRYDFEGVSLDVIDLTDLPSVLKQSSTHISIANPQIYLEARNPLYKYSVVGKAGLEIVSQWDNSVVKPFSMNEPLTIGDETGVEMYQYCISPMIPESYYATFEHAEYVQFESLSEVLNGDGLPSSIKVNVVNPQIVNSKVKDFQLGDNLGVLKGRYTFFAPLDLNAGSEVVYSDTLDGWSSDTLEDLVVEVLQVDALLTNSLPFDVVIKAYPIDVNGNHIGDVEIVGAEIKADAVDAPISIKITGAVSHLDGIVFEAHALTPDKHHCIGPDDVISLSDLHVKVSGRYITEL